MRAIEGSSNIMVWDKGMRLIKVEVMVRVMTVGG